MANETYNTSYFCELPENLTEVVALTVFGVVCIVWILISNAFTLNTVFQTKIESQKKQIVFLLVAALYNAIIGLPATFLQLFKVEILFDIRWCLLSMGMADLGVLSLALSATVVLCTAYIRLKYPLRTYVLQNTENKVLLFQLLVPVLFMLLLMIVNVSMESSSTKCCSWTNIPDWYFFPFFTFLFLSITIGFILAFGILFIAKKQAMIITTIEVSNVYPNVEERIRKRNTKQAKLIRTTIFAFLLTWIPFILSSILGSSVESLDLGNVRFYWIYFSVITIGSSLPVIYSYAHTDTRSKFLVFCRNIQR